MSAYTAEDEGRIRALAATVCAEENLDKVTSALAASWAVEEQLGAIVAEAIATGADVLSELRRRIDQLEKSDGEVG